MGARFIRRCAIVLIVHPMCWGSISYAQDEQEYPKLFDRNRTDYPCADILPSLRNAPVNDLVGQCKAWSNCHVDEPAMAKYLEWETFLTAVSGAGVTELVWSFVEEPNHDVVLKRLIVPQLREWYGDISDDEIFRRHLKQEQVRRDIADGAEYVSGLAGYMNVYDRTLEVASIELERGAP